MPLIRPATPADAAALAALMDPLGYPTTADAMARRMEHLAAHPDYATWIAEEGGAATGMAGAMVVWNHHGDLPAVRLLALVVDPAQQGRGTGAALVRVVEEWARTRGANSVHLTTRADREGAHRFYRGIGYEESGKRFHKALA